jgi:hypothetical protein
LKLRAEDYSAAREVLGYLNFSGGRPDPSFQRLVDELLARFGWSKLPGVLRKVLNQLHAEAPVFHDRRQAEAAIALAFDHVVPAYREFHRDLLGHLIAADFHHPFQLVRFWEAILEQGPPWDETGRIVLGTLDRVNDFLGYRPVAVLENSRRMEPYPHERIRPIPLFLRGVGAAHGPYQDVVSRALELLRSTPEDLLAEAHFSLDRLEELSLDPRAHDHLHPANKRTNYLFGEWDPHLIDIQGYYRRFIVRKVIMDALLQWIREQKRVPKEEVLFDASAVLGGTILMASAISGAGPETHDSSVSLTSLLPRVARQRDVFYARLMESVTGARAKRLEKHARTTQQPFGHVRQYLNFYLAQYGTQQVQRRQVAYLFARMAYPEAARDQASVIPCAAARFECEIQWRLAVVRQALDQANVARAAELLAESEDHLQRGIDCGAIVDPWNILGFQGQFPLFTSREDSVPDQRVEILLQLVEGLLEGYSRALQEAAARALGPIEEQLLGRFERFTEWWDRFATTTVSDLPPVSAQDHLESARRVAKALAEWRAAGEAAGHIAFWREHVSEFQSAKAYAQVVEALLDRRDHVASLGLLMQWLSQADDVSLQAGPLSFDRLLSRWLDLVAELSKAAPGDAWPMLRRLFDYLEANAGEYWQVPQLDDAATDEGWPAGAAEEEEDEDRGLFGAAYEGVTFRDSADDGQFSDTYDDRGGLPDAGEFEYFERRLEPRLQFLRLLAQLWQTTAGLCARRDDTDADDRQDHLRGWLDRVATVQQELLRLLDDLSKREITAPPGDHDSNVEYDAQLQTKLYLVQTTINTVVTFRSAQWFLLAALPKPPPKDVVSGIDSQIVDLLQSLVRGDVAEVRKQLPAVQRALKKEPLLYVPLEHAGEPRQILAARTMQALMRFLLRHLPKLGLLRETWHLLRTAYQMERASRPQGLAVTEFDRLFRIALKSTLEAVVQGSERWKAGRFSDEELIELVGSIVQLYLDQWLEHSSTMRLSSVEALKIDGVWEDTRKFIHQYGAEFFHARQLTLGNVRAILHHGVDHYLEYLDENEDPLHPSSLLADLNRGLDRDEIVEHLRLIYQIVVERYDRFLEYNTTTTQSDYGNMFYCLLDFLRLETAYDRDAWNLLPVSLAHEVLARWGKTEAARIWEDVFAVKTEEMGDRHLADLAKLERQYGMRLPSVTNHLQERFVKPLVVNNMVALLSPACAEARTLGEKSPTFAALEDAVEDYLRSTSGSGLDVPPWLRTLEEELNRVQRLEDRSSIPDAEGELQLPECTLNLRDMRQQLRQWREPLSGRKKK